MSQIYLRDTFPEHPKVLAAGGDAGWLFVCGLGWLKRNGSVTGLIPKVAIPRLSDRKAPMRLAARLADVGLWHDEGTSYLCHEYVEHNAKSIDISEKRRQAAQAKWAKDPSKRAASADASADASASGLQMQNGSKSQVPSHKQTGNQGNKEPSSLPGCGSHSSVTPSRTPGTADAERLGPEGWGNPEAAGPNESPDGKMRRRNLALRLKDATSYPDLLECNRVVAEALGVADWHVVDEQIGWLMEADDPPRKPAALTAAVRRSTPR